MQMSRRRFLECAISGASWALLSALGCRQIENHSPSRRNLDSESQVFLDPSYLRLEREGVLRLREEELWESLRECRLCPRGCGVNRLAGETGICRSTARLKVASAYPHHGEEIPLRGTRGSGTVFFSNCNLLCCYCINWRINHRGEGEYISPEALAEAMVRLQDRGCHNINLVTPTHVVPHILKALRLAVARGLRLPLVYNTSSYDSLEVIRKLEGIVDIYLPDFKYQDGDKAARYSAKASDYPEVAAAVIKEMHRQVGALVVDDNGIARRGVILRHLVLPSNIAGTDRFVKWVASELGPETYVNLMDQYRPTHRASDFPEINRRITSEEFRQAMKWAREAGLRRLA